MQVVRSVDRGERLAIPPTCPPDYAKLINMCWETDPSVRPPFSTILVTLERMRSEYLAQKVGEERGIGERERERREEERGRGERGKGEERERERKRERKRKKE
jgi:Protein tyrosine and serine/threonine kinase